MARILTTPLWEVPYFVEEARVLARLSRRDLALRPTPHRPLLSDLCRIGYVGPAYRRGGLLVVGHSPGTAAARGGADFAEDDQKLADTYRNFISSEGLEDFQRLMELEAELMKKWPFWRRFISKALDHCGCLLDEIAFTNVVPFPVDHSRQVLVGMAERARRKFFGPWVRELAPKAVIWLGKAAKDDGAGAPFELPTYQWTVDRRRGVSEEVAFRELAEAAALLSSHAKKGR